MGTDNLHHKNKARREDAHQRKTARRKPYDRVLIVCEGEKTEPYYFQELCDYYTLATANVTVDGSCDSSPKSVYEHAVKLFNKAKAEGNAYDRVYCVFDKDKHDTYLSTLDKISRQKPKDTFFAISSVPCFEYWLLLHFEFTTRPYAASGKNSIGKMAEKDLKRYLPHYQKGERGLFLVLVESLETAMNHAERSLDVATREGIDNPSTRVHKLVGYLQGIKK